MDTCSNSVMGFKFNCSLSDSCDINLSDGCSPSSMGANVLGPSLPNVDTSPLPENTSLPIDHFDGVLRYLNQMLMEEDLEQRLPMYQDSLALDAAERSFYDVLRGKDPLSPTSLSSPSKISAQFSIQENMNFTPIFLSGQGKENFGFASGDMGSSWNLDHTIFQDFHLQPSFFSHQITPTPFTCFSNGTFETGVSKEILNSIGDEGAILPRVGAMQENSGRIFVEGRKVNRFKDDDDNNGNMKERSAKQFASYIDDNVDDLADKYDKLLLCPSGDPCLYENALSSAVDPNEERYSPPINLPDEPKRGRPRASDRKLHMKQVVDLSSLLIQCGESVASYDNGRANQLLNQIRQHSSPFGNATERLATCFATALEARISGMGKTLYSALLDKRVSADTLKAYHAYFLACPFQRMSNILGSKLIGRVTKEATKIHIIDFGILHGFQWPCFIQGISLRPGGPPKLRITGIDFPQPGFRPAEQVEKTGHRLARYCKKFNVHFEYHGIAKKWETITLEDLKIDRGETIVVNCLYRLRQVPDETAEGISPRDCVLNLINRIKPDFFVHGILNGSYNAPFFAPRFREALFHFSALFDMFEKTLPREDQDRLLLEKEFLGRDVLNIVACEGNERIERPETYKQWQARNQRAGFRQLSLNPEIVKEVRTKVKQRYHKDFLVDEDNNWILQGWKGRVTYAISCWQPVH